jgi:hypothetical protein
MNLELQKALKSLAIGLISAAAVAIGTWSETLTLGPTASLVAMAVVGVVTNALLRIVERLKAPTPVQMGMIAETTALLPHDERLDEILYLLRGAKEPPAMRVDLAAMRERQAKVRAEREAAAPRAPTIDELQAGTFEGVLKFHPNAVTKPSESFNAGAAQESPAPFNQTPQAYTTEAAQ